MNKTTNSLNWFEIPALDIERAKKFYETILDITLTNVDMHGSKMAFFPQEENSEKVSGALVQSKDHTPSMTGVSIYLNANPDLQTVLNRIENIKGKVTVPKTNIGENGNVAFFIDTEGNHIGLHSIS